MPAGCERGHSRIGIRNSSVDPADAGQGVGDDLGFVLELLARIDVLPIAAAAPVGHVGALGGDPAGPSFDDFGDLAASELLLAIGQLDKHIVAGYRSGHKHDDAVGESPDPLAAGRAPLDGHPLLRLKCCTTNA